MVDVLWQPDALADLNRIITHIEGFDPAAANSYGRRLRALGDSLCDFPHRGRPGPRSTREMVTVPPYVLSYEVRDETVHILGIRHGRQRRPE